MVGTDEADRTGIFWWAGEPGGAGATKPLRGGAGRGLAR